MDKKILIGVIIVILLVIGVAYGISLNRHSVAENKLNVNINNHEIDNDKNMKGREEPKQQTNELNYESYTKIEDASLRADGVDTTILVRFNDILYGKSYSIIDYAGGGKSIGKINKLIDEKYVPKFNCETNTEYILNALVYETTEKILILQYNNEYVLFEKIEE